MPDEKADTTAQLAMADLDEAISGLGLTLAEHETIRWLQTTAPVADLIAIANIIRTAKAYG